MTRSTCRPPEPPLSGVGCDVVSISEFCGQLALPGSRFGTVFTAAERRAAAGSAHPGACLAGRWAVKEAVLKAWSGSRFGRPPILDELPQERLWSQIEVRQDAWGRPGVRLVGAVGQAFEQTVGQSADRPEIRVSLSHDVAADVAIAVAVLTSGCGPNAGGFNPAGHDTAAHRAPAQDADRLANACTSAERR